MTPRTEQLLWGLAIAGIVLAGAGVRYGTRVSYTNGFIPSSASTRLLMFDETALARAADTTMGQDPFRLDHHPAMVAFGDTLALRQNVAAPTPEEPLALHGVVGGPPWQAILSGVPGHSENVVVRVADTIAGLRVQRVGRDRVVLMGHDSSLTLTLKRTWQ